MILQPGAGTTAPTRPARLAKVCALNGVAFSADMIPFSASILAVTVVNCELALDRATYKALAEVDGRRVDDRALGFL
jgi:hypothetical protein